MDEVYTTPLEALRALLPNPVPGEEELEDCDCVSVLIPMSQIRAARLTVANAKSGDLLRGAERAHKFITAIGHLVEFAVGEALADLEFAISKLKGAT